MFGADGVAQDAYLICLKAVVPSSVVLPGPLLNWVPFTLYKAQADCIARASRPRRAALGTSRRSVEEDPFSFTASPTSPSSVINVFPPPDRNQRASMYSRASDNDDQGEDDIVDAIRPLEDQHRDRPAGLPRYNPDFVVDLIRSTIEPSKPWNWQLPTKELRKSGAKLEDLDSP